MDAFEILARKKLSLTHEEWLELIEQRRKELDEAFSWFSLEKLSETVIPLPNGGVTTLGRFENNGALVEFEFETMVCTGIQTPMVPTGIYRAYKCGCLWGLTKLIRWCLVTCEFGPDSRDPTRALVRMEYVSLDELLTRTGLSPQQVCAELSKKVHWFLERSEDRLRRIRQMDENFTQEDELLKVLSGDGSGTLSDDYSTWLK